MNDQGAPRSTCTCEVGLAAKEQQQAADLVCRAGKSGPGRARGGRVKNKWPW